MDLVTPPVVVLRIGELEIDGVDPANRFEVARGLERELARLLSERGAPPGLASGATSQPPIVRAVGLAPGDLGREVARALYEGWR